MSSLIILIPLALLLALIALFAFFWSVKNKQFDDFEGASHRILFDDANLNHSQSATNQTNNMTQIIIYSKDICPYCTKAKALLNRKIANFSKKNIVITEIKIDNDSKKEEMMAKSGGRMTVPQIFINNKHIGGCDDLYLLDSKGELDQLL
jgi:glutaredoxin 3